MDFIDLKTQYRVIQSRVKKNIDAVLEHGQYILGPEIDVLERRLAEYARTNFCITVASGTDALLIAMMALGIGADDEVITTPFTFIATGEMIALIGARPVFVDIDPMTYNLNPDLLERAISPRTKAIMPVSLYGQCADFDRINAIANKYKLPVIEDAAQSFGATYKGKPSCALSTIGCTSFFPSKPLGCYGDGGACFTDDAELAKRIREIRVHGQDRRYHHPVIGINGRMDTIQAAVLLAKLDIFATEVRTRATLGSRYTAMIDQYGADITTPHIEEHNTSVYAQYSVQVDNRAAALEQLAKAGIPTAVHYPVPLHLQPAFANLGLSTGSFPAAEAVANRIFSLPMHPYLTEDQQVKVVDVLVS